MSYSIVFRGTYRYTDAHAVEQALSAAREDVEYDEDESDSDLLDLVRDGFDMSFVQRGSAVDVAVDVHGPPGLYPIFEAVVETLAETATDGLVTSVMEGEEVEYPAGPSDD